MQTVHERIDESMNAVDMSNSNEHNVVLLFLLVGGYRMERHYQGDIYRSVQKSGWLGNFCASLLWACLHLLSRWNGICTFLWLMIIDSTMD
jgi:hypothetical protein